MEGNAVAMDAASSEKKTAGGFLKCVANARKHQRMESVAGERDRRVQSDHTVTMKNLEIASLNADIDTIDTIVWLCTEAAVDG